jgi:DNA-directed RNA polymerase specialized sigma24 family protein
VDRLLFRIAHRRAMDWHRETKVALLGGESVTIALCTNRPPEYDFAIPPEAEAALHALERLVADNPRHAQALEAIRQKMAGKSLEEYAAQAGVASGTMRQWVNRFRARACKQMPWCVGFF